MSSSSDFFPRDLPHEIAELDFIGDNLFTLGVPAGSPEQFKKMVFAGAKTYILRNRSIDYLLKSYGDHWKFPKITEPFYILFLEVTSIVLRSIREEIHRFNSLENRADHIGLFASGAALFRLYPSFSNACLLLRQGLWLETACLLKLILEQISWSYSIRYIENDSLFKTVPSKSISAFKKIFPEAATLYGLLNHLAHVSPNTTLEYISFDPKPQVFFSSRRQASRCAYYLLMLVDMYLVCSDFVFYDYYSEHRSISHSKKRGFYLRKTREMHKISIKYKKKLMKAQQDAAANP